MLYYRDLFIAVGRHLERQGVTCKIMVGKQVTENALSTAESTMQIRLPEELREFYLEMGNGLALRWQTESDDNEKPAFANLQVPSLTDLADLYVGWREMALYTPEEAEKYGFPYTKNPALAKQTAARMWHWLPVIDEGNGDLICLDLSDPICPVIFNQHDWLDGGTGDNGHPLAPNWRDFLTAWGKVCFQLPESLWWPSSFHSGGVAWDGPQFRRPFVIEES